jgi:hypothetical protein
MCQDEMVHSGKIAWEYPVADLPLCSSANIVSMIPVSSRIPYRQLQCSVRVTGILQHNLASRRTSQGPWPMFFCSSLNNVFLGFSATRLPSAKFHC